jgi:Na+/proline symporter
MAGGLFTLFYISSLMNGFSAAFEQARAGGKLVWFYPQFSWAMPFNIWMGLIGATFVTLSSHGAEQLIVQRVLACKNVTDGRKALVLSAVVILPLFLVFLLVGALLWAYYESHPLAIAIPEIRADSGIKRNDYIYPIFMMTEVPHILKGFLIVAILSAAMSSVSSALTSLASVSTMDFVKAMTKGSWTEEAYLRFSKYSTVIWAGALIIVAYLSREVPYVLNAAFSLRGLTSGALLGGLALVLFWKRGSPLPVCLGMIGSLLAMIWITQTEWHTSFFEGKIAWPWFTLIGTAITLGLAAIVSSLSGASRSAAPRPWTFGKSKRLVVRWVTFSKRATDRRSSLTSFSETFSRVRFSTFRAKNPQMGNLRASTPGALIGSLTSSAFPPPTNSTLTSRKTTLVNGWEFQLSIVEGAR